MSRATPFRSHLLQQWTQQGRRPPAAAMPWLRPAPASPPRHDGEQQEQQQLRRRHSNHRQSTSQAPTSPSPPRYYSSPSSGSIKGSSSTSNHTLEKNTLPSLSSIDDSSLFHNTSFSRMINTQHYHTAATATRNHNDGLFSASAFSTASVASEPETSEQDGTSISQEQLSRELHSLLISRQTAAKPLIHSTREDDSLQRQDEISKLRTALDRAVQAAMMAPNHKRTEPFSFQRIWCISRASSALAEICYQVTLRRKSEPVARIKKEKWSRIPAFLVALVHNNQSAPEIEETTANGDNSHDDSFLPLKYSPPVTERQLEDYASASAAIQNAMLSLHADGIATKWATGPVIQTMAFRQLVQAEPTDRVAGLVMIGGWNSVKFESEREEKLAEVRRNRRRELHGDVLTDLP